MGKASTGYSMENIPLAVALAAGFLSFLSPCVLPMVPVYIASLYGPEIFDPALKKRLPVFLHSLSFVLGFSVVFVVLGILAGVAGLALATHMRLINDISGSLLVAAGVFMLAAFKIPRLNFEKRLAVTGKVSTGYARSFLTGVVFTLAWTPCASPVLGSILALAWTSQTIIQGGYLLGIYSLGLAIPFLAIGAAFDFLSPLLKRINRYSHVFYLVSGALLIGMGILILTDRLGLLQAL